MGCVVDVTLPAIPLPAADVGRLSSALVSVLFLRAFLDADDADAVGVVAVDEPPSLLLDGGGL